MREASDGNHLALLVRAAEVGIGVGSEDRSHARDVSVELSLHLAGTRLLSTRRGQSAHVHGFGHLGGEGVAVSRLHVLVGPATLHGGLQEASLGLEAELGCSSSLFPTVRLMEVSLETSGGATTQVAVSTE